MAWSNNLELDLKDLVGQLFNLVSNKAKVIILFLLKTSQKKS